MKVPWCSVSLASPRGSDFAEKSVTFKKELCVYFLFIQNLRTCMVFSMSDRTVQFHYFWIKMRYSHDVFIRHLEISLFTNYKLTFEYVCEPVYTCM